MKFHELIRSKREHRMLTIRQVADAVGTTPSYLHELEHGKTVNIRLPLAAKLSRVLKISFTALAAAALAGESRKDPKQRKRSAGRPG